LPLLYNNYSRNLLGTKGVLIREMSLPLSPIKRKKVNNLKVQIFENRKSMGSTAAKEVAAKITELLAIKKNIRMVFAAAPSQNEFLEVLRNDTSIDWSNITVFHMDEYIGLSQRSPQSFSQFLSDNLFDVVKPGKVHIIDGTKDPSSECERYENLITESPIDIVCLGIGENGHIAFNDPPVADFNDQKVIKKVELDEICRQQQVNDGSFATIDEVPTHALTLTIPTMTGGSYLYCIVPGETKRSAVSKTLHGPITIECPASILRSHPDCTLYLDKESYGDTD
jgi:glucosamine-6-phosphate deaminase